MCETKTARDPVSDDSKSNLHSQSKTTVTKHVHTRNSASAQQRCAKRKPGRCRTCASSCHLQQNMSSATKTKGVVKVWLTLRKPMCETKIARGPESDDGKSNLESQSKTTVTKHVHTRKSASAQHRCAKRK